MNAGVVPSVKCIYQEPAAIQRIWHGVHQFLLQQPAGNICDPDRGIAQGPVIIADAARFPGRIERRGNIVRVFAIKGHRCAKIKHPIPVRYTEAVKKTVKYLQRVSRHVMYGTKIRIPAYDFYCAI